MNPRISQFFGIQVYMYFSDHNPPHFHVKYAEYNCYIDIETCKILEGNLPKKIEKLVISWAELYQDDLREDWNLISAGKQPKLILPIDS